MQLHYIKSGVSIYVGSHACIQPFMVYSRIIKPFAGNKKWYTSFLVSSEWVYYYFYLAHINHT